MSEKDEKTKLNIKLDEQTAQGSYANFAIINHGAEEFIVDFIFAQPGVPQARVNSRILLSPAHAKRFLMALKTNIDRYEQVFGPIKVPTVPTLQPTFIRADDKDKVN